MQVIADQLDDRLAEPPRYRAFISYSHADEKFARWLHHRLENCRLPKGAGSRRDQLRPIFLDRAELAAGPDLSLQVREALSVSAALVVIASPAARASEWVTREIDLFRTLHPERPILACLIEGEPEAAFPDALARRGDRSVEPLASDFRKNGDGRNLGLIKLVAGLTGLPLDHLIQRDAQFRHRRVMAVTAAAMALSVVLAALLVMAVRERAEALRQRADAEGMVEFMLTDLRDKLKGVGRLEIMDSVNKKAMDHYTSDQNLDALPGDVLQRRARLLTAMGEDDNSAGDTAGAAKKFSESYRVTANLLKREPNNPDRIFNHAQSEYWVGLLPYSRGEKGAAQPHWDAYLALATRLTKIDPANLKWRQEVAYAEADLCALAQRRPTQSALALQHCRAAVAVTGKIAREEPKSLEAQLDYGESLAWQADAALMAGRNGEALALRQQRSTLASALPARFPGDARALQAQLQAALGLAQAHVDADEPAKARVVAEKALILSGRLLVRDPKNKAWAGWHRKLEHLITNPMKSDFGEAN
ncbi:MAG: toll/interleukin-1 receptor domain-containing protein [Proteobacteria bacterium]|nr:toll/interleukin-1 receptor domain-containing protein [Pseudomonadota bacterium]